MNTTSKANKAQEQKRDIKTENINNNKLWYAHTNNLKQKKKYINKKQLISSNRKSKQKTKCERKWKNRVKWKTEINKKKNLYIHTKRVL